jgi:hypothetical protein
MTNVHLRRNASDSTENYDDEIAVIRGEIWDNCRDWCYKCKIEIPENAEVRTLSRCPKCGRINGFMPKAGIDEYLKTLPPEEREAREKGLWRHLSGLVYKELERETHLYEDFPIPKSWMKVEGVDPHDARPTCWLFGAVSPEEIELSHRKLHRIYIFDYLSLTGKIEDFHNQVKSVRAIHGYEEPHWIVLDKKYGEKTQMEGKSWQSELERVGFKRIRLSHSSPGDVELGHKIVREYLKSQYSTLIGGPKPGLLFAKHNCSGEGGPIQFMFNYQYKEEKSTPEEKYKDWPDCVRYICMEYPVYRGPEDEKKMVAALKEREQAAINSRRGTANA